MKIKISLILLLLLSPLNILANDDAADVKQAVKSFYKYDFSHKQDFSKSEIDNRKGWLSSELYKLLIAEWKKELSFRKPDSDTKPYFDSLPFQPIDEGCENQHKIGNSSINDGKATVEVEFYAGQKCGNIFVAKYKLELVKFKGKWLINDLIYEDGESLSKTLKRKSN